MKPPPPPKGGTMTRYDNVVEIFEKRDRIKYVLPKEVKNEGSTKY